MRFKNMYLANSANVFINFDSQQNTSRVRVKNFKNRNMV